MPEFSSNADNRAKRKYPLPGWMSAWLWDRARAIRLAREISAITGGQLLTAVGAIVGVRLVTELISPALMGFAGLLTGLIALAAGVFITPFSLFVMRGFAQAVQCGKQDWFVRFARRSMGRIILTLAIPFALCVLGVQASRREIDIPTVFLMVLHLGVAAAFTLERTLLIADRLQARTSLISIAEKWLTFAGIAAGALLLGESAFSYFAGSLCLLCLALALFYWVAQPTYPTSNDSSSRDRLETAAGWKRDAYSYALPLMPLGVISWFTSTGNRYILAALQNDRQLGAFIVCYGLAGQPFMMLSGLLSRFFRPIWFAAEERSDRHRARRIMWLYLALVTSSSLLGLILFHLLGNQLIPYVLARPYRQGALGIMMWVAAGYAALAVASIFEVALYAEKRTSTITLAHVATAGVYLVLSLGLISRNGATGAAQAVCLSYLGHLVIISSLYWRRRVDT